jgi:hypothetical protein
MKRIIFLLFITQLAWTQNEKVYPTVSYLDIKLGESGHLSSNPYILEFKNGKKEIVFCGVEHLSDNSDVSNKMFAEIERKFFEFRPNIAINEGGEISKNNYLNKEEAILKDGEIGLLKVLSDSLKIKTINGDPNFEHECKALLKTYSKSELLTYIITERLMWNLYGNRIIDQAKIEAAYNEFVENYIIKKGK